MSVSEKLKISIENLYAVFSEYSFNPLMEGSPVCISDKDKAELYSKSLKEIQGEDISRYTYKAITTWGGVDDFKHYLPRILELLSTSNFMVDTFVILGKLEYANWKDWSKEEQDAIIDFLYSWWLDFLYTHEHFDREILIEINKLTHNLCRLLEMWNINIENNTFKCFLDFLKTDYYYVVQKADDYKDIDDSDLDCLKSWIQKNIKKLEEAFFCYEERNPEFAQEISDVLLFVENTNSSHY